MKKRPACLAAMLLALLALAFSSCAEEEGSGLDGPPDSSEVHPNSRPWSDWHQHKVVDALRSLKVKALGSCRCSWNCKYGSRVCGAAGSSKLSKVKKGGN